MNRMLGENIQMKKAILSLTLAASVLGLTACSNPGEEVIVKSNLGEMKQAEFYDKMKELAGNQILGQLLVEQILADKYKVTDKEVTKELDTLKEQYGDSFKDALTQSGLTEEALKKNIKFQLLQEKATKDVKVSDKEIEDYYAMASKELKARHVLVEDEATAKKVVEELKGGAKFADVAKKYSKDPGSGAKGGDLGWFTVGAMVPEFNDAAYALELNTVSEPVKSQFGYHIIEVTDKRDIKDYGTLDKKKAEIKDILAAKKGDLQTKVKELVKDANIEIKDEELKDAVDIYTKTLAPAMPPQ